MGQDTFIERQSHVGNRIVCPSEWESEDQGAWWILDDHGQASLSIYTCTIEGSGTLDEFLGFLISLVTKGLSGWKPVEWQPIDIGGIGAARGAIEFDEGSEEDQRRIYVLENGPYYHCLILRAWPTVLQLNGEFYEGIVRSFRGIG